MFCITSISYLGFTQQNHTYTYMDEIYQEKTHKIIKRNPLITLPTLGKCILYLHNKRTIICMWLWFPFWRKPICLVYLNSSWVILGKVKINRIFDLLPLPFILDLQYSKIIKIKSHSFQFFLLSLKLFSGWNVSVNCITKSIKGITTYCKIYNLIL